MTQFRLVYCNVFLWVRKGSTFEVSAPSIWALPVRGGEGVSTLARMVWGNFFGKNLLDFGGSRPSPGWVGALFF